MSELMELVDHNIKTVILNMLHTLKNLEKIAW